MLDREQKKFSRKVKFSENWKKQKQRINRIHSKIASCKDPMSSNGSLSISNTA